MGTPPGGDRWQAIKHTGKCGERRQGFGRFPFFKVMRKDVVAREESLSSGPGDGHLRNPDNPGLRAARGEADSWSRTKAVARAGALHAVVSVTQGRGRERDCS